jgi:tetratricopeptide (TPR) repeat protein
MAMPCAKPANKRRAAVAIAAAALTLGLGLAVAGAATNSRNSGPQSPFLPSPQPDAQHYDRCLQMAHTDAQKAYDDAESWRRIGGGFPAQHCAAVALVGLQKYPEAATRLEALANAMMQAGPEMRGDALEQAGQAWLLAGKPTEAKAAFDAALGFKPKDAELLIDRAEAYALGSKYFEAIDDLNAVLDQTPNRVDALVYRASAYRQLGSIDLAFDDVERALRLDPNSVAGLLERGNLRRVKNDAAGAKADWQQVVKLGPGTPAAISARDNLAHIADQPGAGPSLLTGPTTKPAKP